MDARDVGTGSPRIAEGAQVARGPRSRLVRRAALAVVGLATLAFAAPAARGHRDLQFTRGGADLDRPRRGDRGDLRPLRGGGWGGPWGGLCSAADSAAG